MAEVTLSNVDKFYGATQALFDISLDIRDGEFAVFVGPSGCGKSTLLRCVAGLEGISSGSIRIGDRDVTHAAPSDRGVSMVFQSYALYPHMTVRQNMDFGMKINAFAPDDRKRRIAEAAEILQLTPLLDRKPGQLSGGQRQRVAIGRAIVKEPEVFLFDEPLSNLDAKLRIQMRVELEGLHRQLGTTMIYVTHDQVEAMTMADRIVVLNQGRIEQVGSPMDLYHRPGSEFVAGFIGAPGMNLLGVEMAEGMLGYGAHPLAPAATAAKVRTLGIRPEHIHIGEGAGGPGTLPVEVKVREQLGSESYLYTVSPLGHEIVVRTDGDTSVAAGDRIVLRLAPDHLHLFGEDGQRIETAG
ncbi:ABC transporter ATP-binding protein [Jannaschia rubra]|uniref:ABC transporter ATP-binding protein n=1 Tax=Jannaschia rubra TaxID=282197 RepID=UPI0024914876|nr:sn-glycerol-3-phosphate ABC transporter ATP-binding protein UgpC [Jannaschia rubra]